MEFWNLAAKCRLHFFPFLLVPLYLVSSVPTRFAGPPAPWQNNPIGKFKGESMKATVWWFSGTGNSWILAARMARGLVAGGWEAELRAIEDCPRPRRSLASARDPDKGTADFPGSPPSDAEGFDLFCFPVFSFCAPALVDRFLASLPVAMGRRAAVVVSMGGKGYEGRALSRSACRLRDSGREVLLTAAVEMPEAYVQFSSATQPEEAARRTEAAFLLADSLVADILAGKPKLRPTKPGGLVLTWIPSKGFAWIGRRLLGLTWAVSRDCNGCGLCVRACPARTIKLVSGGPGRRSRPEWGPSCEDCQRCANLCPKDAIRLSIPRAILLLIPLFPHWGRILETALGLQDGIWRPLLWLAGFGLSTTLAALVLRLLDRVPGARDFLSLAVGAPTVKRLAPGFLAELVVIKRAEGLDS